MQVKYLLQKKNYVLCPHSAVGVRVAESYLNTGETIVSLGTAHPAKFRETVEKAVKTKISLPLSLNAIIDKKESVEIVPPIEEIIAKQIRYCHARTSLKM